MPEVKELFQLYKDDVYRLAYSFTHSKNEAEDISQTVFLKLIEQKQITPGKEKAWLMQVTANQCRSLLRSIWWKRTDALEDVMIENQPDDEFAKLIENLKPKYRVVLYLFYYEEYSTSEIAHILKISQSNVTTQLARARKQLMSELKED